MRLPRIHVTKGTIAAFVLAVLLVASMVFTGLQAYQVHADNQKRERERQQDIKNSLVFVQDFLGKIKAQNDQQTKDIEALLDRPQVFHVTVKGRSETFYIVRAPGGSSTTSTTKPNGKTPKPKASSAASSSPTPNPQPVPIPSL